jgi:hypothetical protein
MEKDGPLVGRKYNRNNNNIQMEQVTTKKNIEKISNNITLPY